MAKGKAKILTKPQYKNGYEAAQANNPRKAPHRPGTDSESIWFAGYDAYISGGSRPQEPRKRRTKVEMEEVRNNPPTVSDFNTPNKPLPPSLQIKDFNGRVTGPIVPRTKPSMLEKIFAIKDKIKIVTDLELREVLHMELADMEWAICLDEGPKPSLRWEEYKREHNLNFDRKAA